LGVYEDPANPGEAGSVDVRSGVEAENIDILVNFNEIEFNN